MFKPTLAVLCLVGALYSCDLSKKEHERLQSKVDSLNTELDTNNKSALTLHQIGSLIDSIDLSRHALRTKMVEGTPFDDYTTRMKEINHYVKEAFTRIASLENKARTSRNSNSSYVGTIKTLRHELETRTRDLAAIQEQVNKYHNENENLVHTVSLQKAQIDDHLAQIKVKQDEIAKLETNVNELMVQSKVDEGDAYFARAKAVEETANRTRFAPRKKRNTRKEALELYKMAVFYGKEEAQVKVTELEKKI